MDTYTPWWKSQADFKKEKAVVKLYDNGSFQLSVNIPTSLWPLNGPYEAFHWENTCFITDDKKLYSAVNAVKYKIGRCYQNTDNIVKALHSAGFISATAYCGWAFIGESPPVHHCWAVLSDEQGQKAVIDLSSDLYKMQEWLVEQEEKGSRHESLRDDIVSWIAFVKKTKMHHTDRCYPLGKVTPTHLYIGCPCDPTEGYLKYQQLLREYPQHPSKNKVNAAGYNPTQWKLKQQGLMP